jgi:hypothetical protein
MLEIWASIGYILLLAIIVFAAVHWRTGSTVTAIAALVIGIPLWGWWEYARPTWTTGTISGTEVRRSDADAQGRTRDVQYVYMRNQSDAGLELENEDSWWWFKRNSERVFNDAKTAADRKTEVTVLWNRWRSQLFSLHPNVIAIGGAGSWPLWSWRILSFYGFSLVLWLFYFGGLSWARRRFGT